ncbi:727_t:CDS:2, partial [Ambispora gerdemannii]
MTSNNSSTLKTKKIRVIAGSYERILYGIDAKWIKSNIEMFRNAASLYLKRLSTGARPKFPTLETTIYDWVKKLRQEQKVVTCTM